MTGIMHKELTSLLSCDQGFLMFLNTINIAADALVTDIVISDYRTVSVFRKYGIDFCCGGKRPLSEACKTLHLDTDQVLNELNASMRNFTISNSLDFANWDFDFLIDYILNVHHQYLQLNLPEVQDMLAVFVSGHKSKFAQLEDLLKCFCAFKIEMILHLDHEEKIIFPYIRQIAHAHKSHETYSALLVRTLRKPIEQLLVYEHEHVEKYLLRLRDLTNNYIPPGQACTMHQIVLHKLRELDNDMVQHGYLENCILFPKAIALEKEILASG